MTVTEPRSDAELKSAVVSELEWTPSVNDAHIGVVVDHGAVTLTGEVDNYPAKIAAERAALRVRGVTAVAEEITVHSAWAMPNDSDVAREASEALERAIDVPSEVQAIVHDQVVTLSGAVTWHFEREAAARSVRYLRGVKGIHNGITIKPKVSATGLQGSITAALVRNAQLEGRGISVTADGGTVTLEGAVRSWSERRQAETTAWAAPGVTGVHNSLYIGI